MKNETNTGALPNSAGFPGKNMVRAKLHPAITHINCSPDISNEQVLAINRMVEHLYKMNGKELKDFIVTIKPRKFDRWKTEAKDKTGPKVDLPVSE